MTEVCAAIIRDTYDRILICRRAFGERAHLWEFPGGKLEAGETPEKCIIRECAEELGVELDISGVFDDVKYTYPDRELRLIFFDAIIVFGEPKALEHEELRWVRPRELTDFEFCGADAQIAKRLSESPVCEGAI